MHARTAKAGRCVPPHSSQRSRQDRALQTVQHLQMQPAGYTATSSWLLQGLHIRRRGGSPHFLVASSRVKMMLHAVHTPLAQSTHCGSIALHGLTVGAGTGTCRHGTPVVCWGMIRHGQCGLFTRAGSMFIPSCRPQTAMKRSSSMSCTQQLLQDVGLMHMQGIASHRPPE